MSVFIPQAQPFILAIDLYDPSWLKLVPTFFYFSVAWTSWPKGSFGAKSWGRFLTRRRRSSWRHTRWKSARSSARGWSSWPGASSAASGRQLTSSKSKMRGFLWKDRSGRGTNRVLLIFGPFRTHIQCLRPLGNCPLPPRCQDLDMIVWYEIDLSLCHWICKF